MLIGALLLGHGVPFTGNIGVCEIVVPIHSFLREPSEWSEVLEIFGLEAKKAQEHDVFERLRLLYPFAGDADLDGFRIASEVENCIPIIKTPAAEVLQTAPKGTGIKLAPEQIKRIRSHLENPKWEDFRYNDDLRSLLELGRWFEQESFGQILTPVP